MATKKWSGEAEKCDICDKLFADEKHFIDGRSKSGSWALMCRACHRIFGVGIGTGRGQVYDAKTFNKVAG